MAQALINSSYLILELCEDIYKRRYDGREFSRLEVEALWNAAQRGLGSVVDRYKLIALLATRTLDASDRAHIQEQLPVDLWREVQSLPFDTLWPEPLPDFEEQVDLAAVKARMVEKIERGAEQARRRFITAGSGQVMTYQQKYEEATAYLANPEIELWEIPHLVAEVGVTAEDLYQVATVIVWMRDGWKQISPRIERGRLQAKAAVEATDNLDIVIDAADVDWDAVLGDDLAYLFPES